jgi:hypothetical protein
MKNGQIFARKSTNRGILDIEYLDEKSHLKEYFRRRAAENSEVGKKLKAFADYASKEAIGQVHVGGFLHHMVRINPDGTSTSPPTLTNEERKRRIVESWMDHLRAHNSPDRKKKKVIQHRLVFSMSTEQHDALVATGINPDQVLHSTMKKIMAKFNDKFHHRDSIGYAYGIHHDTDNLHVHVALCPRTKNGKYVGCSTSRSKNSKHKRQMDYLRQCFELENKQWQKDLSQPQKLDEILAKRFDSHKIVFNPRLTATRRNQLVAEHNEKARKLQEMYMRINALERDYEKLRLERDARKKSAAVSRFFASLSQKPCLIPRSGNIPYLLLREQQQLLFRLKREYRQLYSQYQKTYRHNSYGAHQTEKNRIHGYRNSPRSGISI